MDFLVLLIFILDFYFCYLEVFFKIGIFISFICFEVRLINLVLFFKICLYEFDCILQGSGLEFRVFQVVLVFGQVVSIYLINVEFVNKKKIQYCQ